MKRTLYVTLGTLVLACTDTGGPPEVEHCFDNEPRPVTVVVDASLMVSESFTWDCEGNAGWGSGACSVDPGPVVIVEDDINIRLSHTGLIGWWPLIEIHEDAARVCSVRFSDVNDSEEYACSDPVCAVDGLIELSRLPTDVDVDPVHVRVDVGYDNGSRIRAEFRANVY